MPASRPIERVTLLSFRTYGDYVLKAPFLFELFRRHPDARITILTNTKGGQVYPLLDSRLNVVVVDYGDRKGDLLRKVLRVPRAGVVYAMDDSRTTLLLALLVRGKRKTGWVQGISRLYAVHGDRDGYFEWKSVRPWLSSVVRLIFRPGMVRLPEDKYEAEVELELLGLKEDSIEHGRALARYRGSFAWPAAARPRTPYIYCAAEAGWVARQLTVEQWRDVADGLLEAFPRHSLVVHGAGAALRELEAVGRITAYEGKSVQQLFDTISAADLVIAPDSFALHLASLYDVPAVGYFGPAHPYRFRPTGPGSSSLFRRPECSPCLQMRGSALCAKELAQCSSLAQLRAADFVAAAQAALTAQRVSSS